MIAQGPGEHGEPEVMTDLELPELSEIDPSESDSSAEDVHTADADGNPDSE